MAAGLQEERDGGAHVPDLLLDAEKEARLVGGGGGGLADGAAQQHPRHTHHRRSHQSFDAGTRDRSSQCAGRRECGMD